MAHSRSCFLCGKEYNFCPTCGEDRHAPVWKNTFCSEDCSRIFHCAVDFNMSLITKEEAQDIILDCDLSNKKSFREGTQKAIAKILEEDASNVEPVLETKVSDIFQKVEYKPLKRNKHEVV